MISKAKIWNEIFTAPFILQDNMLWWAHIYKVDQDRTVIDVPNACFHSLQEIFLQLMRTHIQDIDDFPILIGKTKKIQILILIQNTKLESWPSDLDRTTTDVLNACISAGEPDPWLAGIQFPLRGLIGNLPIKELVLTWFDTKLN